MEVNDFIPDPEQERRTTKAFLVSKKERFLFETYAKEKGWSFTKMVRICIRAIILMEYNRASSLEEALKKAFLLDVDGRSK